MWKKICLSIYLVTRHPFNLAIRVWDRSRRVVVWSGAGALVFVSVAGFAGLQYPGLEVFAHFRVQYVVCAFAGILLAWWSGVTRASAVAGVCLAINLWIVGPGIVTGGGLLAKSNAGSDAAWLRLLHANVLLSNRQYDLLIDFVRETQPDIWFVQEVDLRWVARLRSAFETEYPYVIAEPGTKATGMAAFSRIPYDGARILRHPASGRPSIELQLTWRGSPLRLYSSHPPAPYSAAKASARNLQIRELLAIADADPSPYVLIGDMNNTVYAPSFQDWLARSRLVDSERGRWSYTWPAWFPALGIRIDHCLGSRELAVAHPARTAWIGSDHLPIVCEIKVSAAQQPKMIHEQ